MKGDNQDITTMQNNAVVKRANTIKQDTVQPNTYNVVKHEAVQPFGVLGRGRGMMLHHIMQGLLGGDSNNTVEKENKPLGAISIFERGEICGVDRGVSLSGRSTVGANNIFGRGIIRGLGRGVPLGERNVGTNLIGQSSIKDDPVIIVNGANGENKKDKNENVPGGAVLGIERGVLLRRRSRGRGVCHHKISVGQFGGNKTTNGIEEVGSGVEPGVTGSAGAVELSSAVIRDVGIDKNLIPVQSNATETTASALTDAMGQKILRTRPEGIITKQGTTGTLIELQTNYFRLATKPEWNIYQYRIDFIPDIEITRKRSALLSQHKHIFGGYVFDGTIMFCPQHLRESPLFLTSKIQAGLIKSAEMVTIKIRLVGVVERTNVQQLQVLNLILHQAAEGLELNRFKQNLYDPQGKVLLPQFNLELWPGYQTSIRQHETDILLCTEILHKVMRTDSLHDTLRRCSKTADYQEAFQRAVIGTIVLTNYNNQTYRIDNVDFTASPLSKFLSKDGEITYREYYRNRYGLTVRDLHQPLLVSHPKEKTIRGGENQLIVLIPELCRATGITDEMRSNFSLMKAMSEYTRLSPGNRINQLKDFNKRLQLSEASIRVFESWNVRLDADLVQVMGRILPPEQIVFGNSHRYVCDSNVNWTQEFRKHAMFLCKNIQHWCVIVPRQNLRDAKEFVRLCQQIAHPMGMFIADPIYHDMPDDRTSSYAEAIDFCVIELSPEMLFVVVPKINDDKYNCIKKKCCVDRPVPSQVATIKCISAHGDTTKLKSVATKIVIQMNTKLGGLPWMVQLPISGLMTIGFDVCHSAKEKNKSYGALVATMDHKSSGRFYSDVSEHSKGQELSQSIAISVERAIRAYLKRHQQLPRMIVFYRDGVGEGQLHQVFKNEVQQIRTKIEEIQRSEGHVGDCKLAFIVVSKRINTRCFYNGRNPIPGTVVDSVITLPERYDFFLISQSVRVGTVLPINYSVLYNSTGLSADRIQMLTYKMTHLYYNWSGACRVPAVCQYAHKLAFFVAESIHRTPSSRLESTLYFL